VVTSMGALQRNGAASGVITAGGGESGGVTTRGGSGQEHARGKGGG
jgi:hypothetical protein